MTPLVTLLIGLVLVVVGADFFVRGAVAVARRLRLTPHLIGLTLVAWGGALPELGAGIAAAQGGAPSLVLGNVVGANIANALFALGLAALVMPFTASARAFDRDVLALGASVVALVAACQLPFIDAVTGAAFVALLVIYTAYVFVRERAIPDAATRVRGQAGEAAPATLGGPAVAGIAIGGGVISMLGGGILVADGVVAAAAAWGMADSTIGLTLVALGTSLPEIAAAGAAAYRRRPDIAIASLIGSSIFNGLGVVGAGAMVAAIAVPDDLARLDIWAMVGATLLFGLIARLAWPIDRREGLGFVMAYGLYLLWVYLRVFPTAAPA